MGLGICNLHLILIISLAIQLVAITAPKHSTTFRRKIGNWTRNGSKFRQQVNLDSDGLADNFARRQMKKKGIPKSLEVFVKYTDPSFIDEVAENDFYFGKNPNIGYIPYWLKGDKLFDYLSTTVSTVEGMMCGETCPEMYTRYGAVCGKNAWYTFKTFKNYCYLVNEDCTMMKGWKVAYKGECTDSHIPVYPTDHAGNPGRADEYLKTFDTLFKVQKPTEPNVTTPDN